MLFFLKTDPFEGVLQGFLALLFYKAGRGKTLGLQPLSPEGGIRLLFEDRRLLALFRLYQAPLFHYYYRMNKHNIILVTTSEQYLQAILEGYEDIRAKKPIKLEAKSRLLEKEGKSAFELLHLGMLLLELGEKNRFEAARSIGEELLKANPAYGHYLLGYLLAKPECPFASDEDSFAHMELAAKEGFVPAINSLGYLHSFGKGIEKDDAKAASLYLQAALEGRAVAQVNLGLSFRNGKGVEASPTQAAFYFRLAAEQGDPKARYLLGRCFYYGEGVEGSMPMAIELWKDAAEGGHGLACRALAQCYEEGDGVEQSYEQAMAYYRKGAESGDTLSAAKLGELYWKGLGVEKDLEKAVECFEWSSRLGYPDAKPWIEKILQDKKEG